MLPSLSKSRFLAGLQCHLRLWNQCYHRELARPVSPVQQAIFDMGHEVGRIATMRYPDGKMIHEDYRHPDAAIENTANSIAGGAAALFEAAFRSAGVLVRVDVLERRPDDQWNLIEVKSSTSVKEEYHWDVAVQHYVLKSAGIDVENVFLAHVNRDYVFDGRQLDPTEFLHYENLTGEAENRSDAVESYLEVFKAILGREVPPVVTPSRHCHNPYTCEFWEHCTTAMPAHWVFQLPRISQNALVELEAMGIRDIRDIPESFPLNEVQARVRQSVIRGTNYVNERLKAELLEVDYPLHFLDFEAFNPAIPRYANTRPFEVIPFQWSDHVLEESGELGHREYLADGGIDPRRAFAQTLLEAVGEGGTIIIYTQYEKTILKSLAIQFPEYDDALAAVMDRFHDICATIRRGFYSPGFHGSFSLKSVLPALVPEMDYNDLAIQDGLQAGVEFSRQLDSNISEPEKEKIRQNLLQYCKQDTLAMVKIRDTILNMCTSAGPGPHS